MRAAYRRQRFRSWPSKDEPSKYASTKVVIDGITFDSRGESELYLRLGLLKRIGDVSYFLRQVPFHLPGGVTYRCDFMAVFIGGPHVGKTRYLDFKGFETREFINKKKMVEALYPVTIELVKKSRGQFLGL